jgi:hypothetical protein
VAHKEIETGDERDGVGQAEVEQRRSALTEMLAVVLSMRGYRSPPEFESEIDRLIAIGPASAQNLRPLCAAISKAQVFDAALAGRMPSHRDCLPVLSADRDRR